MSIPAPTYPFSAVSPLTNVVQFSPPTLPSPNVVQFPSQLRALPTPPVRPDLRVVPTTSTQATGASRAVSVAKPLGFGLAALGVILAAADYAEENIAPIWFNWLEENTGWVNPNRIPGTFEEKVRGGATVGKTYTVRTTIRQSNTFNGQTQTFEGNRNLVGPIHGFTGILRVGSNRFQIGEPIVFNSQGNIGVEFSHGINGQISVIDIFFGSPATRRILSATYVILNPDTENGEPVGESALPSAFVPSIPLPGTLPSRILPFRRTQPDPRTEPDKKPIPISPANPQELPFNPTQPILIPAPGGTPPPSTQPDPKKVPGLVPWLEPGQVPGIEITPGVVPFQPQPNPIRIPPPPTPGIPPQETNRPPWAPVRPPSYEIPQFPDLNQPESVTEYLTESIKILLNRTCPDPCPDPCKGEENSENDCPEPDAVTVSYVEETDDGCELKTGIFYVLSSDPDDLADKINATAQKALECCGKEPILAVPEYYPLKFSPLRPQLIVIYRLKDSETRGYYPLRVPYWVLNESQTEDFNFTKYTKGLFTLTVKFQDNSKSIINAESKSECDRVWAELSQGINSNEAQHLQFTYTERSSGIAVREVHPYRAQFWDGEQSGKPTWQVWLDPN